MASATAAARGTSTLSGAPTSYPSQPLTAAAVAAAAAASSSPSSSPSAGGGPPAPMEISWRGARQALGSSAFRVALVALAALAAASAFVHQHTDNPASRAAGESVAQLALGAPGAEAWQLGCAALGFLMYKVAILGVSMAPGGQQGPGGAQAGVVQFEKNQKKAS